MEQCPEHTNLMVTMARIDERTAAQAITISEIKMLVDRASVERREMTSAALHAAQAASTEVSEVKTDLLVLKRTAALIGSIVAAVVAALWNFVQWLLAK